MAPTPNEPQPITERRPTPIGAHWVRNRWEELTFVHWPYPAAVVGALLPDGLRVDTFEGSAYVSLIPFRMTDAAPRLVPRVPWISTFLETNVRTYVVDSAGNRAIWFFSLETSRLAVAAFARSALGFPYIWSDLSLDVDDRRRRYVTRRRRWPSVPPSRSIVEIGTGSPIERASDLDVFLTARWGTVARRRGVLRHHPVDHDPWTLREATLIEYHDESLRAAGLPDPDGDPLVRFAEPVDAKFARPSRVGVA